MLNRFFSILGAVFISLFFTTPAMSDGIFEPSVGIEYRFIGGSWVQNDPQTQLDFSLIMGTAVDFDAIAIGRNRLGIGVAYLGHLGAEPQGTTQINVLTKRQQTDFTLIYRHHWNYVCLSAAAGASMGIISTTTRIYNLGPPSTSADGTGYVFNDTTIANEVTSTGVLWGPTFIAEVGLDLGRLFRRSGGRFDNFMFLNLAIQYAERDRKHELLFWGAISIFPMAVKLNAS